jgi:phosphatidylglycerophosphate synthase
MDCKQFFAPNRFTFISLIILMLLFYLFLSNTDTKLFPCKVKPVLPNAIEFEDSICSLSPAFGISTTFTPLAYFILFLVLFVFPYVIASTLNYIVHK